MQIITTIRSLVGCIAGICIYFVTKTVSAVVNSRTVREGLSEDTRKLTLPLFPHLDLNQITIRPGSSIPSNWFRRKQKYVAITFGNTIYYNGNSLQDSVGSLNILMHELVHSDQVRMRNYSEIKFAADYGKGYLSAGNYRNNPLEEEAFDFVDHYHFTPA
jgi:hypothetical protein